jgi:hypothetical protein
MYCAGFGFFMSGAFATQRLLIPGDLNVSALVNLAAVSVVLSGIACWWAGDFWRRLSLILLLAAFAAFVSVGVGVVVGVALSDWRMLTGPLAIKGLLISMAGLGCWFLASHIHVVRKVFS